MTKHELNDLIDCIKIQVGYDIKSGKTTTVYKLPENARTEEIKTALIANFEHYKNANIEHAVLTLDHPDLDK